MTSDHANFRYLCLEALDQHGSRSRNTWTLHKDGFYIVYDSGRLIVDSCEKTHLATSGCKPLLCVTHPMIRAGNVWDDIFTESKCQQDDLTAIKEQLLVWLPLEALARIE